MWHVRAELNGLAFVNTYDSFDQAEYAKLYFQQKGFQTSMTCGAA